MSVLFPLQYCQQIKSQYTVSGLGLSARAIGMEGKLLPILTLLCIYVFMLLNGLIDDISELNHLLSEGAFSESMSVNSGSLFDDSLMSSQLLIGLCWLLFLYFPARRTAMVLRKTAVAFCETLQSFISLSIHGCRAPPAVNG